MKQSLVGIFSGMVIFVGLNVAISNNNVRFSLHGWAHFGVGVIAATLILTGIGIFVEVYHR